MVDLHETDLNTDFHNSASSYRIIEAHKEFSIQQEKIIKYVKEL